MLSVIIITFNNAATVRRTLESVAWAGEIVVVDSGSTDGTLDIVREFTANVHQTQGFPGHGPQKNRALGLATGDWVLCVDADEWVTPHSRAEIEAKMPAPGDFVAFVMPRRSSFCGRFMRHSGWWPDYITRLWVRGKARLSEDHTHERLLVDGKRGRLKHPLMHESVTDLEQVIVKLNFYSSSSARMFHASGKRASIFTAIFHGWWAFVRTYFLRLGFLDGREGFMVAVANAENSYYRYAKLALLGKPRKLDHTRDS